MCAICPNVRVQQDAELPERAMERERELAQYHFSITLNPLKDMFEGHCFNTWHASKPAEPWICRRNAHPKPSSDHFWLFPELVQAELLAKL